MKHITSIILSILISFSLHGQKSISISASAIVFDGLAGISDGVDFSLVNLESGKIYYSKVFSFFKQRHSIIENLPAGKYRMYYFQGVPAVEGLSSNLQEYFGELDFEPNSAYYLGNFIGRSKVGKNTPLVYTIDKDEIPRKLLKTLKKRKLLVKDEELIRTYPYSADSLVINIKASD